VVSTDLAVILRSAAPLKIMHSAEGTHPLDATMKNMRHVSKASTFKKLPGPGMSHSAPRRTTA